MRLGSVAHIIALSIHWDFPGFARVQFGCSIPFMLLLA
jgi:hypothetical protein